MKNEVYQDRPANAVFRLCPSTVKSGDAVLLGNMAAVAGDDYNAGSGGTWFRLSGSFTLLVKGQSTQSPNGLIAINPGDEIFATGTPDATTNVTTSLTLDHTIGNVPFGSLDQTTSVALSATAVSAIVKLKEGAGGRYAA